MGRVIGKSESSKTEMAKQYIIKGLKILNELEIRPWYSEGYLYLGELNATSGDREEALIILEKPSPCSRIWEWIIICPKHEKYWTVYKGIYPLSIS